MSHKHIQLDDKLLTYTREVSLHEPDVLRRLREETATHPQARMQITPEQGQFMSLLIRVLNAKKALEIGVFTGYSGAWVALALPADGKLIGCDVSEEYTSVARRYWREAGIESKIDLRLAPALQTLDALIAGGEAGTFDFAFIDADKKNYENYYERALTLLRPGGLIAVDNVLWDGRVCDPKIQDTDTVAIRAFNKKLYADTRIALSLLPFGDGITLAYKR
jgi:caffeoyl-CoA O-methyltransferase